MIEKNRTLGWSFGAMYCSIAFPQAINITIKDPKEVAAMRQKTRKQLPLAESTPDHPKAEELAVISQILDRNPIIYDRAQQDLTKRVNSPEKGAKGMTAEQVVRAAIIKQTEGFSYKQLAFHIQDSRCYMKFCKVGFADKPWKKSGLQRNIKALRPETWEFINQTILADARQNNIEDGRQVRIDCTVTGSNIHEPTDSSLLWDCVRVLNRLMGKACEALPGLNFPYHDHCRRAKRRSLAVLNAKDKKGREKAYKDLLTVTGKTINYAKGAVEELKRFRPTDLLGAAVAIGVKKELDEYISLAGRVTDQTERRVIKGEQVPSEEKVFSIFEPHTDIIIKDRRDIHYGHKVCLTGGKSNLILDCVILEGNPADSTLSDVMLDRQEKIYGHYPKQAAFDGGFASRANLETAKGKGVEEVCFAKGRGLDAKDMCSSHDIFKKLRNFRAGIESGISWLKRCFGLWRCLWKGFKAFKSYIWSAAVSANLLTLARAELA